MGQDGTGFFKIPRDCTNTAAGRAQGGGWGGDGEKNKERIKEYMVNGDTIGHRTLRGRCPKRSVTYQKADGSNPGLTN